MVVARGRLMHSAPGDGAMGVVFADVEDVKEAIEPYLDRISVAAVNAPNTVTISGESTTVAIILNHFKSSGVKTRELAVSHAFHSPLMDPIINEFRGIAEQVEYSLPTTQFISCLTGLEESDKFASADYWTDHIRQPVMFQAGFQALESSGYKHFLEIGADTTLSGLGKRCQENPETMILPTLRKKDKNSWITLLKSVGTLYINGFNPDWDAFDAPYSRRKVELPTYAFQGKEYQTPMRTKPAEDEIVGSSVIADPKQFLGVEISSPALDGVQIFQNRYSPLTHTFLRDHVIGDRVIFPGAGMVTLFFSTIKATYGITSGVFKDLTFLNMMKFQDDGSLDVQVILKKNGRDVKLQLVSKDPSILDSEWLVHCEGLFLLDESTIEPYELIESLPKEKLINENPDDLYNSLKKAGSDFGVSFRLMNEYWHKNDFARAHIRLRDEVSDGVEYDMYPGVFDAVIVAAFAKREFWERFEIEKKAIVPYAIETIRFYHDPTTEFECHVASRTVNDSVFGDTDATTDDGRLFMQVRGMHGRVIEADAIRKPDLNEVVKYFHHVDWVETPREVSEEIQAQQQWLFVNPGDNQLADTIKRSLELDKHQITTVAQDTLSDRLATDKFDGITYFATVPDNVDKNAHTPQLIRDLLEDFLTAAKALITSGYQGKVYLVTQGVHSHSSSEEMNLIEAPLWGFGLTLGREFPELNSVIVDISGFPTDSEIEQLCLELTDPSGDNQIIIRESKRSIAKFVNVVPKRTSEMSRELFRSDASYLITGGTGGLGLTLVDWMVENGAGTIILTDIKDENDIDLDLTELARGEDTRISYIRCNVSDSEEVMGVFDQVKSDFPPLKGVFHLAGLLDDGVIMEQTMDKFRRVLAPKSEGAFYLHQATESIDLDHFVLFSSIASVIGSPGQANYSSANRFLDSLAVYRRQKGLAGTAVNWSIWKDVGMAAVSDKRGKRIEDMGVISLSAHANLSSLEKILMDNLTGVTVTHINWQRYFQLLNDKEQNGFYSNFKQETDKSNQGEETVSSYDLRVNLADVPPKQRQSVLMENVVQIASDVIGYVDDDLDIDQPLTDQGFDSLSAVELRNQLGQAVGTSLPVSLLFDYPTVIKITEFLLDDVLKFEDESATDEDDISEEDILGNIEQLIKGE
ncbi:MAG: SDR family NAD(P)-dependent oxidoreductase [Candidatus Electryoneaceae bacterium]|nr:SDR family NAD(P)-dependent oxidoreductase [Candidatus Electryoneaceae bacterium]